MKVVELLEDKSLDKEEEQLALTLLDKKLRHLGIETEFESGYTDTLLNTSVRVFTRRSKEEISWIRVFYNGPNEWMVVNTTNGSTTNKEVRNNIAEVVKDIQAELKHESN